MLAKLRLKPMKIERKVFHHPSTMVPTYGAGRDAEDTERWLIFFLWR
jgi:hypothetical protein